MGSSNETESLSGLLLGKPDWCLVNRKGTAAICQRVESPNRRGDAGWLHCLSDPKPPPPPPKPKTEKPVPLADFGDLACKYQEALIRIDLVAEELGVSERSLERLNCGWNGNVTFPMRDSNERVVGIRIRGKDSKWCVTGSHQGLFWPENIDCMDRLFLCEGPTDCAALLTLGFQAIGRPSCSGGVGLVQDVLRRHRRDVVIMSDRDSAKIRPDGSEWYPGQEGAEALAEAIKSLTSSLRVVTPPKHKDIRQWLNAGATQSTVQSVIDNTGEWR